MPPEQDEYVFPHPWLDLRGHGGDEAATRDRLERELLVEVGPEHPLAQRPVKALAHFTRQDEVLLAADSGYVIAHLTWAGRHDPFVTVRDLTDWDTVVAEVEDMAANW